MRYVADHDFHIHSTTSPCCNDESQTTENILKYAKENNYKRVCLTNHIWDENVESVNIWHPEQRFDFICRDLPLPQETGIKFLFGAEADMDYRFNIGVSRERFEKFDFINVSTTHLHVIGYTVKEEVKTVEEAASLWVKRLDALINKQFPKVKIGVAHLTTGHIFDDKTPEVINSISDNDMFELFKGCAEKNIGIELNSKAIDPYSYTRDILLRPYEIAKECGCKFYLGSDAHKLSAFAGVKDIFNEIIDLLDLDEADKFIIN